MSLAMSLRSRGAVGSAGRVARVLARFGSTASAMRRRLDAYQTLTTAHGIQPTWPTTACVLERHPALLRSYAERGVELALHGLVHGDHARLDAARQRETLARGLEIFDRAGISITGFRGPYLRYNDATLEVVRSLGLRYHSTQAVSFPLVAQPTTPRAATGHALARALYQARDASAVAVLPRMHGGLVDIPVAIPDDEILVDRLAADGEVAAAQWGAMLDQTYRTGELLVIQLHPERIYELGSALDVVCAEARRRTPAVYIARLDELAAWWLRRSAFGIVVTRCDADRYHVAIRADADATVLLRVDGLATESWSDQVREPDDFDITAGRSPAVGVSARTPGAAREFLVAEGFAIEPAERPGTHGAFIDVGPDWRERDVLDAIEQAPGPLVRIARWPRGARSALAVTGDIDALTLGDFARRSWETRGWSMKEDLQ